MGGYWSRGVGGEVGVREVGRSVEMVSSPRGRGVSIYVNIDGT